MVSRASYYLRVDIDDTSDDNPGEEVAEVVLPDAGVELTLVDLHTRLRTSPSLGVSQIETLTGAVQDRLHLCSKAGIVLFRWPWLAGPDESHSMQIENWIERLTGVDGGEPVLGSALRVGVIQHRVADEPILRWGRSTPTDIDELLCTARAVELEAMLRRHNGIWEPKTYHYRLPSGEHTDVFIRLADAIQEPQDAYVLACWLSDRLRNGTGVVVDTGGLTPLLIQIESFLSRYHLSVGPTAILQAYPTGRPIVRRTVENAISDVSGRIVAVLSVSSTGNLQNTLLDELERVAHSSDIDYTLDVMVNRTMTNDDPGRFAPSDSDKLVSWFNLTRTTGTGSAASCDLCRSTEKTPFVAVDPRTYGTMALPSPHLVMPDTNYATAAHLFWERAAACGGRAIEVNPHHKSRVARGKRTALPVRPIFELITQPAGLADLVKERWQDLVEEREEHIGLDKRVGLNEVLAQTALVVAESHDIDTVPIPAFAGDDRVNLEESLRVVLAGVGLDKDTPLVTTDDMDRLNLHVASLDTNDAVLVFAWGSVTGLTLRRLKLAIADSLGAQSKERSVNGLVFHARPSTPNEWKAQQNQFRPGVLECLWTSCFPWHSPLRDEDRLLDRPELDIAALSDAATAFVRQRKQFLGLHTTYSTQEDDWSPRFELPSSEAHPEHIFWGMSHDDVHQSQVRGRSLYGKELDCLTAYAAMGSVINFTRLNTQPTAAPRWVMFDMGRIVRSYFDAVITCSIIRWLQPGELWWGTERDDADSVRDSVAFLFDQAAVLEEQVLLVPEMLLASAQGKVPESAHGIVRERAQAISSEWPDDRSLDSARGSVEVGLWLLDAG